MKKLLLSWVLSGTCWGAANAQNYLPSPSRIQETVNFLAADKMKGRGIAEAGSEKASDWIEKEFRKIGLKPGNGETYFQDFTFSKGEHIDVPSRNVIGFLDNGAERTIVIGAHYDHLGTGEMFDGKIPVGQIYNGADDNASGIAGLLELARFFVHEKEHKKDKEKEKTKDTTVTYDFNFLFIAFGAEEMNLQGSAWFTEHPTLSMNDIHFMLNMDMIGRYNDSRGLGIGGYGSAQEWPEIFKGAQEAGIHYFTDDAGKGPSDHHNFYIRGIPVIFLHTGPHDDYHKPTDDAEKVRPNQEAMILKLAIQLIQHSMKFQELHYKEVS